jgi:hypothetical protein
MVSNPMNYFMGICSEDKEIVKEILKFDEFEPPLIIDIEKKNKKTANFDNFG